MKKERKSLFGGDANFTEQCCDRLNRLTGARISDRSSGVLWHLGLEPPTYQTLGGQMQRL